MIAFLRHLFLEDFWLKLFSLVLAALVWLTITLADQRQTVPAFTATAQRTFQNLPVMVMSAAADVRSIRVDPKEVNVTVRGDEKMLQKLDNKDIHVLVDLTGIEAAHDMRKRIDVFPPAGVTHWQVDPPDVQVFFPPAN